MVPYTSVYISAFHYNNNGELSTSTAVAPGSEIQMQLLSCDNFIYLRFYKFKILDCSETV